jgi:hypothetical protein
LDPLPQLHDVVIDPGRPLLIVDVDEVLGLFFQGFGRFVSSRGYELRLDRFALLQNIFAPGASEHLDLESGRALFDDFFRFACDQMEPAPGAVEALDDLSRAATVIALTNAPDHAREPRRRWMDQHGFGCPLLMNAGLKGAPVAAMAGRTTGPVAFVDDLLVNLDSVAEAAPGVRCLQMNADPGLFALAPSAPDRHPAFGDWPTLHRAIAAIFGGGVR